MTNHRSSSDYTVQLIASHRSSSHQSISHQSTNQAPVITHQKSDKDDPVVNKINRSSELLFPSDPQNSSALKRVLLPLEPDFTHVWPKMPTIPIFAESYRFSIQILSLGFETSKFRQIMILNRLTDKVKEIAPPCTPMWRKLYLFTCCKIGLFPFKNQTGLCVIEKT